MFNNLCVHSMPSTKMNVCTVCVFQQWAHAMHMPLLPALFQWTYLGEQLRADAGATVLQNSRGHLWEELNMNWLERKHHKKHPGHEDSALWTGTRLTPGPSPTAPIPGPKLFMCMVVTKMTDTQIVHRELIVTGERAMWLSNNNNECHVWVTLLFKEKQHQ